ncbi:unnamed protein product, partial [Didymodactylos carnosus]
MFGQRPRSDSDFWKIVKECNIIDEEQLPTPIECADIIVDKIVEQPTINETVTDDFDKQKENDNLTIDNFIPEMFPLLNTNNDTTSQSSGSSALTSNSLIIESPRHND